MVNPMSQRWRKYSPQFRRDALEKMKTCDNVSHLAPELGVRRKWLYAWKWNAKSAMAGDGEPAPAQAPAADAAAALRRRIAELEALAARQSLELDFFRGALQRIAERRRKRELASAPGSMSRSGS
jgi:transposase-like protein